MTLEAQGGSKACAVVEAPALLHLSRAGSRVSARHIVAWGTASVVVDGCLAALHALAARACHPYPLLKAQLCTGERKRERERKKERERERTKACYYAFHLRDRNVCPQSTITV